VPYNQPRKSITPNSDQPQSSVPQACRQEVVTIGHAKAIFETSLGIVDETSIKTRNFFAFPKTVYPCEISA
jgi:hypothetical protein